MQALRSLLIQVLVVAAAGGVLGAARAAPAPAATTLKAPPAPALVDEDVREIDLARFAQPQRSRAHCRQVALSQATSARTSEPTRTALGGSHCYWACYPGSGCQYVCQYFPQ